MSRFKNMLGAQKGQVAIAVIGAIASIFGSLVMANTMAKDQIADVRVKVAAVEATQNAQYNEIINRLVAIDKKLEKEK